MVAWRYAESLPICEQALALARDVGAREAEVRALTVLGGDLAYLGRGEEGVAHFRQALQLAERDRRRIDLERAYVNFTDALTMLGRPRESARLAQAGLEAMRRYGIHSTLLVSNRIEALLAIGDWDEAERLSAAALRGITSSFPYLLLIFRADVEIGRGEFDAARAHLEAASATLREERVLGLYDAHLADLALWERRWTDADAAVHAGLARARQRAAAQIRVELCAKGLRAQAELAALARARRDADALARPARPRAEAADRRAARRRRGLGDHAERRRLARARRGRVRARPRRGAARSVGGRGGDVGPARAPAARGLLPLAPGRGARRRRRLPYRGERCRSETRTPSRLVSERSPCAEELELLAERGAARPRRRRTPARRTARKTWRRSSA